MRRWGAFVALASFVACGVYSAHDDDPQLPDRVDGGDADAATDPPQPVDAGSDAPDTGTPSSLPECGAQRSVHVVAGNGGLAWFTLLWPMPAMISGFSTTYAYDDPARAASVGSDPKHPLFVRKTGADAHALFATTSVHGMPTAFVAGNNETHTSVPTSLSGTGTTRLAGLAAAAQKSLGAQAPVVVVNTTFATVYRDVSVYYAPAAGGPDALVGTDADDAAAVVAKKLTLGPIDADALKASAAEVASWGVGNAHTQAFADALSFAAHAFAKNYVSQVVIATFFDDPHAAFDSGNAGVQADDLARALDGFYATLAAIPEPACSHDGKVLSLADNVVLVVDGDTPKDTYVGAQWPDGTPANTRYYYVRSNGWLVPGWFGSIHPPGFVAWFDPASGAPDAGSHNADTVAAMQGALYAIVRGDAAKVNAFAPAAFDGLVSPTKP
jgi:hypothetical protein